MGKQDNNRMSGVKDSGPKLLVVGIICLAAGLIIGYLAGAGIGFYTGKTIESAATPDATSFSQTQAPKMDPAEFQAREAGLKSTLSSNPKDLNALIQLGNLYYDDSKFQDAVDYYGKALEIDPQNVDVRTDRGSCYWSLGQADAAIGEFQKSLQVNPSHAQTLFNMGIVYLHGKNDLTEAKKAWEKLLATNPNYPDRARLQQMLISMGSTAANPSTSPMPSGPAGQNGSGSKPSMDDLFKRMKK
jgi:tetratricopeptide (TPR) repeat protein